MNSERWQQIEEIYYSILDSPADERNVLLNQFCQRDPDLRREVESLLLSFANNRSGYKLLCSNAFITVVDTVVRNWCVS